MRIRLCLIPIVLFVFFSIPSVKAEDNARAQIEGHVVSNGNHVPFASITLKGTSLGTSADNTGHFRIANVPAGKHTFIVRALGYTAEESVIEVGAGATLFLEFDMKVSTSGLEGVVVTASRAEQCRRESSVIVNTITPDVFFITQSQVLSEALNFSTGLRVENNCQNCGFNQLRMNGLDGTYSQILINSRPVFSGLAGVYGLELIPANMIERVEIVRGGGSALYGSNAIAGVVNVILQDPYTNSYELGFNTGATGFRVNGGASAVTDNSLNFNASVVSQDFNTGLTVYGFIRERPQFDANSDGFSELSEMDNTSMGARIFHRLDSRNKITLDLFNIKESRRGGDRFDYPLHQATVAEAVSHRITSGAFAFDQYFRYNDLLSLYVSAQQVHRDSYYGAERSLSDYGFTKDLTYTAGAQYRIDRERINLTFGIENQGGSLRDQKLGYADYQNAIIVDGVIEYVPQAPNTIVSDQKMLTTGAFTQIDYNIGSLIATMGIRLDHYRITDVQSAANEIEGTVLSPRVTFKYDITPAIHARASYSKGYRAPQVFDEALHILTSTARKVLHRNDPELRQETSHSYMASLDFNKRVGNVPVNLLLEGFHTQLENPFANEYGEIDEHGVVVYTRINAQAGAMVQGINMDLSMLPTNNLSLRTGFTLQRSLFAEPHEFGERRFFKSPDTYGFFTLNFDPDGMFGASVTGTYTGSMLIPYFGPLQSDPDQGELRTSKPFYDIGTRIRCNVPIKDATMQLFAGVRNMLNAYQNDFDHGSGRDPGYMYGPTLPRTIYFGLRIGNMLK